MSITVDTCNEQAKKGKQIMGDVKAKVSTPLGDTIGFFVNPKVVNLASSDFEISGTFVDEEGRPFERIEFNPEIVPYTVDLSCLSFISLKSLVRTYVQRGRQPVVMTGVRP
jgi:hypothetical protein